MSSTADAPALRAAAPARARRDPLALASLVAIGVVVALVSLPSLRGLAIRQNESDAARVVRALAQAARETGLGDAVALLEETPSLRHRFGDLERAGVPGHPGLLRANGYLFDLAPGPAGLAARAWPWELGRTGRAAFVAQAEGALLVNAGSPAASGPARPPRAPWSSEAGWRAAR